MQDQARWLRQELGQSLPASETTFSICATVREDKEPRAFWVSPVPHAGRSSRGAQAGAEIIVFARFGFAKIERVFYTPSNGNGCESP
jgi:hypothetical protein